MNLHSHLVLHIWDLGLIYLTAAFNGYDSVAFRRLIPPLHQSTSHNVGINSTGVLIYYRLNAHDIINNFSSKCYLWNNNDTTACMWKTKSNACKKFRDIRHYKSGLRNKNNTFMWFAGVYFSHLFHSNNIAISHLFHSNNIANFWMVYFKMCFSLIFLPFETEI